MIRLLFDTHTHLNDEALFPEAGSLIERARAAGVGRFAVPGYDRASCERALDLADRFADVYAIVGFHPNEALSVTDRDLADLAAWCALPKVVAVGEIGLDYHYDTTPKDVQRRVFVEQIGIARACLMPVVIHNREAHADVLDVLRETGAAGIGGVLHCFSGSTDMMRECVRMNFYIGLDGPVTYKNAKHPLEVARETPIERLLVETDAPWLTPAPHRGKRNEPAYVRLVAERIAAERGMSFDALAAATWENANRLFRLEADAV